MPIPRAISVANYGPFADQTTLELRPLTLLYGRNSAGKSKLLRLLPLVGDSVSAKASAPIELSGEAGRGSTFFDLMWKGRARQGEHLRLGFSWDAPAGLSSIDYTINLSRERRVAIVKSMEARDRGGQIVLQAMHSPEQDEERATALHYDVRARGGPEQRIRVELAGLVPEGSAQAPVFAEVNRQMLELRDAVQWITAIRSSFARLIPETGARPKRMLANANEAPSILRSDPEIQEEVACFYRTRFERALMLSEVPPAHYRVLLPPVDDAGMDIDLLDAGEGMAQMLPVALATAMARRHRRGGPRILGIEEPESHLHTDSQRQLAEHLCELAAEPDPPVVVLETHSYALLLAVQLEIARGRLARDRVLAYWVHQLEDHSSRAERVTFDEQGRPEGSWPPGVFADHRDLARELLKEQLGRGGKGAP